MRLQRFIPSSSDSRCFVLDDGTTRIAPVVIDNSDVSREVLDEAKRQVAEATGLPPDRLLLSCTHTQSPVSARWKNPLQPEEKFTAYQRFAAHRIADGLGTNKVEAHSAKIVNALLAMAAEWR